MRRTRKRSNEYRPGIEIKSTASLGLHPCAAWHYLTGKVETSYNCLFSAEVMASSGHSSPRSQSRSSMPSLSIDLSNMSPTLDSKSHKHYKSHVHVETPYPMVKHAVTWDASASRPSAESFFEARKHHHLNLLPRHMPNPVHTVEDHIADFRFGHAARSAKRDAKRLSERNVEDKSHHGHLKQSSSVKTIPEYEETTEDWSERDARAWADELKKREAARRMSWDSCGGWTRGWVPADEQGISRTIG